MIRVGIDTGGTFTDAVRPREDGSLQVFKLPTTPQRPAQAVLAAEASPTSSPSSSLCASPSWRF